MSKSIWIVLIASMLVGVGGYAGHVSHKEAKKGGCDCGKPK